MNFIAALTSKDDKYTCAFADKIVSENQGTDEWYEYFDNFVSLLNNSKSLERNRSSLILFRAVAVIIMAVLRIRRSRMVFNELKL